VLVPRTVISQTDLEGVPLRLGPSSIEEALREIAVLQYS